MNDQNSPPGQSADENLDNDELHNATTAVGGEGDGPEDGDDEGGDDEGGDDAE